MKDKFFSYKEEIKFARYLLFIIACSYILFGIIYEIIPASSPLDFRERMIMAVIFLIFLLISFISNKIKENIYEYTRFVSYLAIVHLIYLSYIENFSVNYIISLLIVIIVANLIFKADKRLYLYNIAIVILLSISVYLTPDIPINKISFLVFFIIILYLAFLVNRNRYNIERKFEVQSKEYETVLNNTTDAIFLVDVGNNEFKYTKTNTAHAKLTGLSFNEIIGKNPEEVTGKEPGKKIRKNYQECVDNKEVIHYEETLDLPGGKRTWDTKLSPVIVEGKVKQIIGVSRDITQKKEIEDQIEYLSFHDSLTGLYNRGYFEEEMQRLDTERQLPLSLIIGDVNGLKIVNDAFGHQKGDELLKRTANILKKCCRDEDIVARWGGDEFVILLPQTSKDEIKTIYQRIKKEIKNIETETVKLSITFGYTTKTKENEDINTVFKKAEDWMYRRKLVESKNVHANIIDSLKQTLHESSHENFEHCQRLKNMAFKLGKSLGLLDSKLTDLELLAELHDIGKVAISNEILEKEEDLTTEERQRLNKHSEIGYQIAKSSPQLNHIAEALLHHHENWDGTGYPHQLKGEEIPYLSRILKVVNEYDKMRNYHPNVETVSKEKAIKKIKAGSGSKFSPEIVEAFINQVLDEKIKRKE